MDDPFDQLNPAMANVAIIDDNTSGPDNRPTPEGPVSLTGALDAAGQARVTFTVSMQPGNNYRAGASCRPGALNQPPAGQTMQDVADAINNKNPVAPGDWSGYSVPLTWSPMLTVWRKLHVEVDSMAAPDTTQLDAIGTITTVQPNVPVAGQATLRLSPDATLNLDLNHYEEGVVIIGSCPFGSDSFPVIHSGLDAYTENGVPIVEVLGIPGLCGSGSPFTLRDDDRYSALGTPTDGRLPDGGALLALAFAPAYILPSYAPPIHTDVVPFAEYLDAFSIEYGIGSGNDGKDLASTPDFWVSFVVGAWEGAAELEGGTNSDGDPDFCFVLFNPPNPRAGAETPVTGSSDPQEGNAVIFFQALADDGACTFATDENHTVVHEVGHTCGDLPHKPGTIMETGAPRNIGQFDAEQLVTLRSQDPW